MADSNENKLTLGKAVEFFSDCKEDFSKFSSPTSAQTVQATIVTLAIMLFIAFLLALLDFGFNRLMSVVL